MLLKKVESWIDDNQKDLMSSVISYRNRRWQFHEQTNTDYLHKLYPAIKDYFHILNSLYLFEVKDPSLINTFKVVFSRDGLQGVVHFFRQYPTPEKIRPFIIVADRLWPIVPQKWRKRVLTYSLYCQDLKEEPIEEIYMYSFLTQTYSNLDVLKEKLKELNKIVKKSKKVVKVKAILFLREDPLFPVQKDCYHFSFQYFQKLYEILDCEVQMVPWEAFAASKTFKNSMLFNLSNENIACSDDYMNHFFLRKQGRIHGHKNAEVDKQDIYVPISAYHGHYISEGTGENKAVKAEVDELIKELSLKGGDLITGSGAHFLMDINSRLV